MSENDEKIDGEKEIQSNSELVNESPNQIRNNSFEVSPPEIELDITVGTNEQPHNESHTSENSSSEVTNVLYEYPDDSEFSEAPEYSTNLRKRPSNTIVENTFKKTRSYSNGNINDQNSCGTAEKDSKPSGSIEKSNVSPQIPRNAFVFGCKHKLEGETKTSDNVFGRRTDFIERFTRHKGDSKCQHDVDTTCSSDEADIEDNVDDSIPTRDNSSETLLRILPISSTQKQPLNKTTDTVKPHYPLPGSSKTVAKPGTVSVGSMIKNKKPFGSGNKGCTSGTSKKGKSGNSPPESKVKSDVGIQKKRRCQVCKKKLGLTAISCRCGGLFCSKHRYDKEHDCNFDYKAMGAEEIRKNNPKVVAEKVNKI